MSVNEQLLTQLYKNIDYMPGRAMDAEWQSYVTLCEHIAADPRFSSHAPEEVIRVVDDMVARNKSGGFSNIAQAVELAHSKLRNDTPWLGKDTASVAQAVKTEAAPDSGSSYAWGSSSSSHSPKPATTIERVTAQWEGLATDAKVRVGISFLAAGMAAIASLGRLSHVVNKDQEGKTQIDSTNLVVGGASFLLAVGMGYLGMAQLRSGAAVH